MRRVLLILLTAVSCIAALNPLPVATSCAPTPAPKLFGVFPRKDVTVTLTLTSTEVVTVFISTVETVSVVTNLISFSVSAGPTVSFTDTITANLTSTVTSVSTIAAPTRTSVPDTATPTAAPAAKPKWYQAEGLHIFFACVLSMGVVAWPLMLLGMWIQRRRSRQIQKEVHQVNVADDIQMHDMEPSVKDYGQEDSESR